VEQSALNYMAFLEFLRLTALIKHIVCSSPHQGCDAQYVGSVTAPRRSQRTSSLIGLVEIYFKQIGHMGTMIVSWLFQVDGETNQCSQAFVCEQHIHTNAWVTEVNLFSLHTTVEKMYTLFAIFFIIRISVPNYILSNIQTRIYQY
jgi:hypothetical protein